MIVSRRSSSSEVSAQNGSLPRVRRCTQYDEMMMRWRSAGGKGERVRQVMIPASQGGGLKQAILPTLVYMALQTFRFAYALTCSPPRCVAPRPLLHAQERRSTAR